MAEQTLGAEPTAGAILADGPVTDGTGGAQIADRRSVLRRPWLAVLAAAGGAAALAGCDVTSSPFDRGTHLLRRLTYGANPAGRAHLRAVGEAAWLDDQLDPSAIDTHALDAKLAGFPALAMTVPQLYGAYPDNAAAQEALGQLRVAALIRAVESPAQLLERMVEFWSDHFNVTAEGRAVSLLKIVEDREVMRVHTLGRFKDLLVADASSPAMLLYLDNYLSKVDAINENYGRELLELHTVGRDNGYTYDDIVSTRGCSPAGRSTPPPASSSSGRCTTIRVRSRSWVGPDLRPGPGTTTASTSCTGWPCSPGPRPGCVTSSPSGSSVTTPTRASSTRWRTHG